MEKSAIFDLIKCNLLKYGANTMVQHRRWMKNDKCNKNRRNRYCEICSGTFDKWKLLHRSKVQTVSISYLRCLIEHVRCYILDRDIELIYYTIRKSSDVLTRDSMQLGAQVMIIFKYINEISRLQNDSSCRYSKALLYLYCFGNFITYTLGFKY